MNLIKKLSALCAIFYIMASVTSCSVAYRERHRRPPPPPPTERVIIR